MRLKKLDQRRESFSQKTNNFPAFFSVLNVAEFWKSQ